jgi:phenylacetate-CoA ligase
MLDKFRKIYTSLPKGLVGFLRWTPNNRLYGSHYSAIRNNISFDPDVIVPNLNYILNYARNHTVFGRENIPSAFKTEEAVAVLKSLPLISSDDIAKNIGWFSSDEYSPGNSYYTTTGGTGRNPTTILLSNESYGIEWAHINAIWETTGYSRKKCTKLTLRGKTLKGKRIYEYNPLYNEVVIDTFKLNKYNFPELLPVLKKYNIRYVHGYPSLVSEFIEYAIFHKTDYEFKGFFIGSEEVPDQDKIFYREKYHCPVVSWYGNTEKVTLAPDLDGSGAYKVFTSYGYPYILNPDQTGFGEIIGTTFVNKALPLFNYRTGDYGRIIDKNGAIFMTDIKGRWGKDFVYINPEKRIPTSSINLHSLIQREILFYQINQDEYAKLKLCILPKPTTTLTDEEIIDGIKNDMKEKLKDFDVVYIITHNETEIIRSKRGKMLMLVQNLKKHQL